MKTGLARIGIAAGVALVPLLAPAAARAATDRPIRSVAARLTGAGDPARELVLVVAGDNRPTQKGGPLPRAVGDIFREIALIRPDLVLWTGDTIYGYGDTPAERDAEYEAFLRLARPAGVPVFNAPGNHEIGDHADCDDHANDRAFEKLWGRVYGSFDYAGIHFIALDTNEVCREDRIEGEQLAWLEGDLAANADARAIFVFTHTEFHSARSIDSGDAHDPIANAEELHRLFLRHPVKAVFSGHEHLYSRETHDGIDYFVAGGAGAPLYAPPERGGFSHYLLVRVPPVGSERPISVDVVEPGRLAVVAGVGGRGRWVANANDAAIPLRGLSFEVPDAAGPCAELTIDARVPRRTEPIPATIVRCGRKGGRRAVEVAMEAPRRSSAEIKIGTAKTP